MYYEYLPGPISGSGKIISSQLAHVTHLPLLHDDVI